MQDWRNEAWQFYESFTPDNFVEAYFRKMSVHLSVVHGTEYSGDSLSGLVFEHAFAHGDPPNSFAHILAQVIYSHPERWGLSEERK